MEKQKAIHLIRLKYGYQCSAVCDRCIPIEPIEATIKGRSIKRPKGTFNPKKVTCKRCLKSCDYKGALDKVNNPLFYWRENT